MYKTIISIDILGGVDTEYPSIRRTVSLIVIFSMVIGALPGAISLSPVLEGQMDHGTMSDDGMPPRLSADFFKDGGFSDMDVFEPADESRSAPVTYKKPASYSELLQWYQNLEMEYPNYLKVWKINEDYGTGQIPTSTGGSDYDYWMVRLTNESTGLNKPEVLFIGTPHGDEIAGPIGQYWFANWSLRYALSDGYTLSGDGDAQLRWMLDNREIYMAVNHNPDGFDRVRRYDANNWDLNRKTDYKFHGPADSCPNLGTQNPWDDVNGNTIRQFVNDHQFRTGSDFHAGTRMLLYPWGNEHGSVQGMSKKSGTTYNYAPPDFYFYDVATLRLGDFIGSYGGNLGPSNTGPPAAILYSVCGSYLDWGYSGDINYSSEDGVIDDETFGNYDGAGIMWVTPEMSSQKVISENSLGGDASGGYGPDVRRFLLHQVDLAQPHIWLTPGNVQNDAVIEAGDDIDFAWKVDGALVVDHTYIQWGTDQDPMTTFDNSTTDHDENAGKYFGGTGWENAKDGIHTGYTHTERIVAPDAPGDYYFVIKAQVDQAYKNVLSPSTYGATSFLRMVRERTDDNYSETVNGADGTQTINGQTWWYSDIVHVKVVKTPHVLSTNPIDGADMVPTTSSISMDFDMEMDRTATEAAFTLDPSTAGSFSWDSNTMTFKPDAELEKTTLYTATVGAETKAKTGSLIALEVSFTFTTALSGDVAPPNILRTDPLDGAQDVPTSSNVTIEFDEVMDQPSVEGAFSILPSVTGNFNWSNGSTVIFRPSGALEGDTDYKVSVTTAATDPSKNPLPLIFSFDFKTGKGDVEPPSVIMTSPSNLEENVSTESSIKITFSEPMNTILTSTALSTLPPTTGSFEWDNNTMIFRSGSFLRPETLYRVTVAATAVDLSGNPMAGAYVFTFTTRDIISPDILDVDPPNEATKVPLNKVVTVVFSEPMVRDPTEAAFSMYPSTHGTFEWDGANMTFKADEPFMPHEVYRINISTLATDLSGNSLTANYTSTFTTGGAIDNEPPVVVETFPPDGMTDVSPFSYMTIRFSEEMDPSTTTQDSINILPEPLKGGIIAFNVDTMRFDPNPLSPGEPGLVENTKYTVTINTLVSDLAGNQMVKNYIFRFTTGITTVPTILRTDPLNGDVGVAISTDIEITFSKAMNLTTVESAFSISPSVKGTFSISDQIVTFKPDSFLKKGTEYTFKVDTKAKDMSGNPLLSDESFSFTTLGYKIETTSSDLGSSFLLWLLVTAAIIIVTLMVVGLILKKRRKTKGDARMAQVPPSPGGDPMVQEGATLQPSSGYNSYDQQYSGSQVQEGSGKVPGSSFDWSGEGHPGQAIEQTPAAPEQPPASIGQPPAQPPQPPQPQPDPTVETANARPAEATQQVQGPTPSQKEGTGVRDIDDIISSLEE